MTIVSDEDRAREDTAIKCIEARGGKYLYTYTPKDVRRHCFVGKTLNGLHELEAYANTLPRTIMYVDLEGLSIVLGSSRLRMLMENGYMTRLADTVVE